MAKIALFGSGGFIGGVVAERLLAEGHDVTRLTARRLRIFPEQLGGRASEALDSATIDDVGYEVLGHDAVVNVAGLPTAAGHGLDELYGANAGWPLLLALACERAGVARLVQLSSVAVQGFAPVLDDRESYSPTDAYGASRVRGEQLLGEVRRRGDVQVTVYRVPAVYGAGRRPAYPLASLPRRLPLAVVDDGCQPVAVAHVDAIAAAVVVLAVTDSAPAVVTHPDEGHTVRSVYRDHEPGRRVLRVPSAPLRIGLRLLRRLDGEPRVTAARRRLVLALAGQAQAPSWLADRDLTARSRPGSAAP